MEVTKMTEEKKSDFKTTTIISIVDNAAKGRYDCRVPSGNTLYYKKKDKEGNERPAPPLNTELSVLVSEQPYMGKTLYWLNYWNPSKQADPLPIPPSLQRKPPAKQADPLPIPPSLQRKPPEQVNTAAPDATKQPERAVSLPPRSEERRVGKE